MVITFAALLAHYYDLLMCATSSSTSILCLHFDNLGKPGIIV